MTNIDVLDAARLNGPYGAVVSNFIAKIAEGFARSVKDDTIELWATHDTYIRAEIESVKQAGQRMAVVQSLRDDVPLNFKFTKATFTLDEVLDIAIYESAKGLVSALYDHHKEQA